MKLSTTVTLLVSVATFSSLALGDVLSQKTIDAKAAWENAKVLTASAETRKKVQDDELLKLQKPIREWGATKLPYEKFLPWCGSKCTDLYNSLKSTDGAIELTKLSSLTEAAESDLDTLNTIVQGVGLQSPSLAIDLIAQVIQKNDLSDLQQALLIAACYREKGKEVDLADCKKNVGALTNKEKQKAPDAEFANYVKSVKDLFDITGQGSQSFCGPKCIDAYNSFVSVKDKKLLPDKLPSVEICENARDSFKSANANSIDDLISKTGNFTGDNADEQKALVLAVCSVTPISNSLATCITRLDEVAVYAMKAKPVKDKLTDLKADLERMKKLETQTFEAYRQAQQTEVLAGDEPVRTIGDRLAGVRRARCATAYCWGGVDGRKFAVEPTVDLPIGMYWSAGGGALAQYVNANNIKIHAAAGLRYWFAYDAMSIGILLAQPELTEAQATVDFKDKSLSTSQVRRPYPTLIVGVWGDIIQLSVSYDELRNPSRSSANYIQDYPANAVLSRAVTFGVALNPVTAARNGVGASVSTTEVAK